MNGFGTVVIGTGVVILVSETIDAQEPNLSDKQKSDAGGRHGQEIIGFGVYTLLITFFSTFAFDVAYRMAILVLIAVLLYKWPHTQSVINQLNEEQKKKKNEMMT